MAEKIEWYGEIPSNVNWLTFADQSDKGYKYNNDFTQITATTDDNGGKIPDEIKFVVDYNNGVNSRTCEVKFIQKDGGISFCYISQNGSSFEQIWKHAPKNNSTDNNPPTDAVIKQSGNETQNAFEVAVGNYNVTRMGLLFSVGSGKDENHRQNSFEVDKNKIKAYNGYINSLTANTLSASTISVSTIVNESGTKFDFGSKVSYEPIVTKDVNTYEIGRLIIGNEENVIYGKNEDKKEENPTKAYIHVAYSNSPSDWAKESEINDPKSSKYNKKDWQYIGFNSSFIESDSDLTYTDYTWTKYQGESGISGEGYKLVPIQEEINAMLSESDGKITKTINAFLTYRLVKTGENGYTEEEFDDTKVVNIYVGNNGNETTSIAKYFTGSRINDNKYWQITGSTTYNDNLQYYIVTCNDGSKILDQRIVYVKMPTSTIFKVTDSAVTISQQASDAVRDLAKSAITHTNFENEYNRYANGLNDTFKSFETTFNAFSGTVTEDIKRTNELIRTSSANSLTVSQISKNLSVGSVNLLYDTLFENIKDGKFVYWSTWGSPSTCSAATETDGDGWSWLTIKSTSNNSGLSQNSKNRYTDLIYCDLKPNSYYTFSFYAYGDSTHADVGVEFLSTDNTHEVLSQVLSSEEVGDVMISKSWDKGVIPLTPTKTRYWFTFKTPNNENIGSFNAMIGFGATNGTPADTETIHFAKPQLEEGIIPTDWKENSSYYDKKMSSKIEQTSSSITLSVQEDVENKLVKTGIDIENGKITLNADNTTVKGDFKVSALDDADGITLINSSGQPAIMLMNKSIDDTITNVQNGKFGGSARILLSWGTEVHRKDYEESVVTEVCYVESGQQYTISSMTMSINTDGAGNFNQIRLELSESGILIKDTGNAQQAGAIQKFNGIYTATHTGSVVLTAKISTNFNTIGKHPSLTITGIVSRDSSAIIALGDGGFAIGLDTNQYMSFDKAHGLTVINGNDGIRLNGYGLTRLRTKKGVNTWIGEAHNIYCLDGGLYDLMSEKNRAYDTILCTGLGSCTIDLSYSDNYPLVDGMTINIIDKCKGSCYVQFNGKALYKANSMTQTTFGSTSSYELDGNRIWKFMYSEALGGWIEMTNNS